MVVHRVCRGFRTLFGEFHRLIDKLFYFKIDCLQLTLLYSRIEQPFAGKLHWVFPFPLLNLVAGTIIRARIALVVADVAIRLAFNQSRAPILASTADCRLRGLVDRDYILSINGYA